MELTDAFTLNNDGSLKRSKMPYTDAVFSLMGNNTDVFLFKNNVTSNRMALKNTVSNTDEVLIIFNFTEACSPHKMAAGCHVVSKTSKLYRVKSKLALKDLTNIILIPLVITSHLSRGDYTRYHCLNW